MTGRCDGCAKFTNTLKYEYYCSDKCYIDTEEKEYAAMTRDAGSTCQCDNTEDKLRINIYKEVWQDTERENAKLREEKAKQHTRIVEVNDTCMRLTEENRLLRGEIELLKCHKEQYKADIIDLEQHNEKLFAALNSVRNTLQRASNDIEGLIRVD